MAPPVVGSVTGESGVFYAAWLCPDGIAHFRVGSLSEAIPWITAFDPMAAATANSTIVALTAAEQAVFRNVLVNQGWLPPVTLTAIAYKQRIAVDGISWIPYGAVAIGTLCTMSGKAGDQMLIPRASVKMASKLDTQPATAWAHCG
jgi:hypothetical protein